MLVNNQLKHGVFWTAIERFFAQGIQFVLSIIIARLLIPNDYGLIAMISLFLGLSQNLVDSGFVNALIQKKNKTEIDYNTAFYFNIVLGFIIYIILFFSAPFIAAFYEEPRLVNITRVMGVLPIITSLGLVVRAKLLVNLDFKKLSIAGLLSACISGALGVYMAYSGYGVWALVFQTLLNYLCSSIIIWIFAKWVPSLTFSVVSLKSLWHFGSKLLLTSMLHSLYENLYALLIGKKYSSDEAGLFNRSQTLAMFPALNISTILLKVFYPVECKIQDDIMELRRVFLNSIKIACFLVFPLMIGFAALAEPFIILFLKEQWLPAVPVLRILSLSYMFNPLMLLNTSILSVKGRTDLSLKAEFIKKILGLLIIFGLIPFGLNIVCIGFVLYSLLDIIIITFFVKRVVGIGLITELKEILPAFLISVLMGCLVFLISILIDSPTYQLVVGIITGVSFYIFCAYIFGLKEFNLALSVIKKY